jgi:hypothetical protein
MNNNFNLKTFLAEGKLLKEEQLSEIKDNDQALGILFHSEEDEDGMIDYFYDEDKVIEVIRSLGYDDAEEIAKEVLTISSPSDELEFMRNKTDNPDLDITDLTVGMFKQSIEDEFEK